MVKLVNNIRAIWRRDRDSNPGDGHPPTRFPSVRLRPLGHLSVCRHRLETAAYEATINMPQMRLVMKRRRRIYTQAVHGFNCLFMIKISHSSKWSAVYKKLMLKLPSFGMDIYRKFKLLYALNKRSGGIIFVMLTKPVGRTSCSTFCFV